LSNAIGFGISTGMVQIFTAMPSERSAAISSAWNAATDFGASANSLAGPSPRRMTSAWSTKSNSISNTPPLYGIAEVVSPRALT